MSSRSWHGVNRSVYSKLFDDPGFQALPPHARLVLLTARLCPQAGPAAIFVCYPELLSRQTGLPCRQVEASLKGLEETGWVQREGLVLWIVNGLRYDPILRLADPKHRKAVTRAIASLPKLEIVLKFCDYYQIVRPFDGPSETKTTLALPKTEYRRPNTEDRIPKNCSSQHDAARVATTPTPIEFRTPPSITEALDRAPRLGRDPRIRSPGYWQALVRAHSGVDFGREILKAEAWMVANPERAPRKRVARFLASWISGAERPDEEAG